MTDQPAGQQTAGDTNPRKPQWIPLPPIQRRVLGVLIEKSKTTPDSYPMSLNALRSGCNQKSNRLPTMNLDEEQVESALEKLRGCGAVVEVFAGRVAKYRHYASEWFGTEGSELAVLAELILRGTQSVGDLRSRASRMSPISDQSTLKRILDSLKTKKLVLGLTPEGRGHMVTHGLFLPEEFIKIQQEYPAASSAVDSPVGDVLAASPSDPAGPSSGGSSTHAGTPPPGHDQVALASPGDLTGSDPVTPSGADVVQPLREELETLRAELSATRSQLLTLQESLELLSQEHEELRGHVERLRQALDT